VVPWTCWRRCEEDSFCLWRRHKYKGFCQEGEASGTEWSYLVVSLIPSSFTVENFIMLWKRKSSELSFLHYLHRWCWWNLRATSSVVQTVSLWPKYLVLRMVWIISRMRATFQSLVCLYVASSTPPSAHWAHQSIGLGFRSQERNVLPIVYLPGSWNDSDCGRARR
jgi:hypothetical protein